MTTKILESNQATKVIEVGANPTIERGCRFINTANFLKSLTKAQKEILTWSTCLECPDDCKKYKTCVLGNVADGLQKLQHK